MDVPNSTSGYIPASLLSSVANLSLATTQSVSSSSIQPTQPDVIRAYKSLEYEYPRYPTNRPQYDMPFIEYRGGSGYYLPVIRYSGLYHAAKQEEKRYCGTFYFFEPFSNQFLNLGKTLVAGSKVQAMWHLLKLYASSAYSLPFEKYEDQNDDPTDVQGNVHNYLGKEIPSIFFDFLSHDCSLHDLSKIFNISINEKFDYEFYYMFGDYKGNKVVSESDFLDQPLCNFGNLLGLDTIIIQKEPGERHVNTEILDLRSRDISYSSFQRFQTDHFSFSAQTKNFISIWYPEYGFISFQGDRTFIDKSPIYTFTEPIPSIPIVRFGRYYINFGNLDTSRFHSITDPYQDVKRDKNLQISEISRKEPVVHPVFIYNDHMYYLDVEWPVEMDSLRRKLLEMWQLLNMVFLNEIGMTQLMYMSFLGYFQLAKTMMGSLMVEKIVENCNMQDIYGRTALHYVFDNRNTLNANFMLIFLMIYTNLDLVDNRGRKLIDLVTSDIRSNNNVIQNDIVFNFQLLLPTTMTLINSINPSHFTTIRQLATIAYTSYVIPIPS